MEKKTIFQINGLYRDDYRVTGYEFGQGEKSACVIGNFRGNEYQQIYTCSQLIRRLESLEKQGRIIKGKKILVIPSGNPYSINVQKRFWATDNTDINRMFPGYNLGETTQRIAEGIFDYIKDYTYGMQFTSFYMPGTFMPHVRMMKTGFEDVDLAKEFNMPYVVLRKVRPYDTTTLNYNWQIWETKAFSMYTTSTSRLDVNSANQAVNAILRFFAKQGIIQYESTGGFVSRVLEDADLVSVRTKTAGFFHCITQVGMEVEKGDLMAEVIDPYEGTIKEKVTAPISGTLFFSRDTEPITYANTAVFKLVPVQE